ncbi:mechanosensitive ion channel family protein [Xanthovirga aplysinae]|uniref:mechanosensitive ion channel family protein n=1 Tax=Xanthovirga aplysinae TaxID=2529853 RepID=UPI0012BC2DF9|nr:mechanosensitive ion channel family protein [Xanthovirga aplysinae]MTI32668.1 mechanosensitive ion channel family protein [Xanthovirga aplysinae]
MLKRIFLFLYLISFLGAVNVVSAQSGNFSSDIDLSSPRQSIHTFLNNMQEDNYNPAKAASLFNTDFDSGQAKDLALKFSQILNAEVIVFNLDDIPDEANFVDSVSTYHRYVLIEKYPELYLEKMGDKWLFSSEAASWIKERYAFDFPFGTDKLIMKFNSWLVQSDENHSKKILGLYPWQLVGIGLILIISFLLYRLSNYLVKRGFLNWLRKIGYEKIAENYIMPIVRPFSIAVTLIFIRFTIFMLQLPTDFSKYLLNGLKVAIAIVFASVLYHLADLLSVFLARLAAKTKSTLDDTLIPMVNKALKFFVVALGAYWVLGILGVDVMTLLAALSIGGIALALAAQDTIKNFFGSFMIILDKPFQIGDWVTSGEFDGTVEEVGFRSTRIRTFRNSVTYVPNGMLADMIVDNNGMRTYRRFYTTLTIRYDTPIELIDLFTKGLKEVVLKHPDTRKDNFHIYFNDMSASSLDIMFYIFFKVPDWGAELKARHEILLEVMKLAQLLGVEFAYPTQTLHVENMPEKKPDFPSYSKDLGALEAKLAQFVNREK